MGFDIICAKTAKMNPINHIKLYADVAEFNSPTNAQTGKPLRFRRNDDITLDVVFFNSGKIANIDSVRKAVLEIIDIGDLNSPAPRSQKTLLRMEVDSDHIYKNFSEFDMEIGGAHVVFEISEGKSDIPEGPKWLRIYTIGKGSERTTFSAGWIEIEESYGDPCGEEQIFPPEKALTKDIADGYYLSKLENLADIYDKEEACKNIGAATKVELESQISEHTHESYDKLAEDTHSNTSKISALSINKRENPKLYFDKGYLSGTLSSAPRLPVSISWTGSFTFVPNCRIFSTTPFNSSPCISAIFSGTESSPELRLKYSDGQNENYMDFDWKEYISDAHAYTAIFISPSEFKLFIDGIQQSPLSQNVQNISESILPSSYLIGGSADSSGYAKAIVSKITLLNCDMSASNALYSVSDYAKGKDIPPMLLNEAQYFDSSSNWTAWQTSLYTVDKSDGIKIIVTTDYTNSYALIRITGLSFPPGTQAEIYYESVEQNITSKYTMSVGFYFYGNSGKSLEVNLVPGEWITSTAQYDSTEIRIITSIIDNTWVWETGKYVWIKGLKIRINGTLFSFDGALCDKISQDKSGNYNDSFSVGTIKSTLQLSDFSINEKLVWVENGPKALKSSVLEVLPKNSKIRVYMKSSANGSITINNGSGVSLQTVSVVKDSWVESNTIYNNSEKTLVFSPSVAPMTLQVHVEGSILSK